jgi:AcrR family transcriptional regulator
MIIICITIIMSKPNGRLTRSESAAETRRRLLDAAAFAFAREGYGGASVQRIAEVAGKTTGALYAHFAGKEDLFLALLRERLSSKVERLAAIATLPTPEGRQGALAERFGRLSEIEGDWDLLATEFWLYAVRKPKARKALARFHEETRDAIARLLEIELDRQRRRPTIPLAQLAGLVIALGDGLGHAGRVEPTALPPSLFATAVQAILRGHSKPEGSTKVRKPSD